MRRRKPILLFLFIFFTTFTLLEMWLLFLLARVTSIPITILIVIVSALVGSVMAKREGVSVIIRAQRELAQGKFPAGPLADGVMILVGGALLITPGLITDVIGFTTLIPACRAVYRGFVMRAARKLFVPVGLGGGAAGGFRMFTMGGGARPGGDYSSAPPPPRQDSRNGEQGEFRRSQPVEPRPTASPTEGDYVDVEYRRVDD